MSKNSSATGVTKTISAEVEFEKVENKYVPVIEDILSELNIQIKKKKENKESSSFVCFDEDYTRLAFVEHLYKKRVAKEKLLESCMSNC